MSIEHPEITSSTIGGVDDPEWFTGLVRETTELDHAGVSAAVLALRVRPGPDHDRRAQQAKTLLRRLVRSTDRIGTSSTGSCTVLLSPLESITDMATQVHALTESLDRAGLDVVAGFAHRRSSESLVDTWARAEAEADRAAYRAENSGGLLLGE